MVVIFTIAPLVIIMFRRTLSQNRVSMAVVSTVTCNCSSHINPRINPSIPSEENSISTPQATSQTEFPAAESTKLSTFLLIIVPVRPDIFEKRLLIRNTWYKGYESNSEVILRFFVGIKDISDKVHEKLREETSTYGDIIVVDHMETPRALTNKTIALMKWASNNVDFSYLMKCNDNTYVYVDNAISELKKRPITTNLYYGKMMFYDPVVRDHKVKWADPQWDLGDAYMPYALGGGYILSSDLVVMLAEQADYLKWHLKEDAAVGSWLVPYEYERRSDELVCVTDTNGVLKYKCVEKFPIFHIFYHFPLDQSSILYFRKLYNEYTVAKEQ